MGKFVYVIAWTHFVGGVTGVGSRFRGGAEAGGHVEVWCGEA
jgi:hypothetical protein